jgi:hypothetical protein
MEESRLFVADQLASWIGHAEILAQLLVSANRLRDRKAVGNFLQIVGVLDFRLKITGVPVLR